MEFEDRASELGRRMLAEEVAEDMLTGKAKRFQEDFEELWFQLEEEKGEPRTAEDMDLRERQIMANNPEIAQVRANVHMMADKIYNSGRG